MSFSFLNQIFKGTILALMIGYSISVANAASDADKKKLMAEANGLYKVDEFKDALDLFLKYDAQYPGDNEAKYKIGLIYLQLGQNSNALKYFKQVNYAEFIKIEEGLDNYLGRSYHENNKFDSASIYYKKYLVTLQGHHSKAYNKLIHEIEERIEACKNGAEFKDRSLKVYISNIGKGINSKFDDYSPV
ncbi:MAG: tetratricopeptide repeat protein, partial [Cytophagales bacterium]|nr:tetratricopeptide repeat protein [Cytophagales bacterium]